MQFWVTIMFRSKLGLCVHCWLCMCCSFGVMNICRNKEEKYSVIHLSQNVQVKMTVIHTPSTNYYKLINCTNEFSFMYKPPIILCLFLLILDWCVTCRWSLCTEICCKDPLVVTDTFISISVLFIITTVWIDLRWGFWSSGMWHCVVVWVVLTA
jgi:hypothetical protein